MKRMTKRMWRSVISMVLALSLVLGMTATAFASTDVYEVNRTDVENTIEELYGMLEDYCAEDADAQKALDAVKKAVKDNEADLAAAKAELEAFLAEKDSSIDEVIDEAIAQLNVLNAELKAWYDANPEKVASIEKSVEYLEALVDEAYAERAALYEAGEKALAAIDKMIEIGVTNSDEDMAPYIAELKAAIEDVDAALDTVVGAAEAVNATIDEIVAVAAEIVADVDALIEEVKAEIERIEAEIEKAVDEVKAELEAMKAKLEAAIADIEAAIDAVEAAIVAFNEAVEEFNAAVEAAIADAIAFVNEFNAAVEAAIADAIAAIEAAIEAATTCDYEINKDSYYVALGDAVAAEYAALLAADLGVATKDLSAEGMTAEELFAVIEANKADIEKADLITLGLGNAEIMAAAMAQVEDPAELDWSKYVGAENTAYVEEALAAIADELAAAGITGEIAEMILDAVEGYAYAYTTLLCNYPEAVNAIKAINPEAQVIIVGMYNPLAGMVIDVNGTEVALGDYVDYLIAASNAHYFGYALLTGNAIYVDAPDVEISLDTDEAYQADDIMGILAILTAVFESAPTEAGYEYIAEQILNAMNITKAEDGIWGDANGDGVVDSTDAMLVCQYDAWMLDAADLDLSVCDVNGDDIVDSTDAMLICQYDAWMIDKFPVEE